ncbi:LADA_0C07470g1_1 [Lachancea dasiensis]|uniref:LADA_0C07470g1_1 n=1 Tax=Lachancea dasiensis TaxID=1072105 RepID=A0A1G4IZK9_9SACH|nr:LADA_0C07470g1_1 [Lachancea dasiensis]
MELKELTPEPVAHYHEQDGEDGGPGEDGRARARAQRAQWARAALRQVQRHSVWPWAVYFPLHAANALVVGAVAPAAANEVLMMVRELLPEKSTTATVLVVSAAAHVASGVALRVWRWVARRQRAREDGPDAHRVAVRRREFGLVGGLSGYFIGAARELAYNPQVVSGYVLVPAVAYHARLMAGSEVDFDFVRWILQNERRAAVAWAAGAVPLAVLVWSATYHLGAGLCQFARISRWKWRKTVSTLIFGVSTTGLVALWRLSRSAGDGFVDAARYRGLLRALF